MSPRAAIPLERIDEVLGSLPEAFVVASSGEARLVVGPPGAFVLLDGSGAAAASGPGADRAALLAVTTRTALADHLAWVPFIDAVVVTAERSVADPSATAVPLDLLAEVLTEGPLVIDDTTIAAIAGLVAGDQLSTWRAGLSTPAAKIDLCQPTPDTTPSR
jgi:hypothetical protein